MPEPPIELTMLRYREKMGLSWSEYINTPWVVVARDLEILGLESQITRQKVLAKRGKIK